MRRHVATGVHNDLVATWVFAMVDPALLGPDVETSTSSGDAFALGFLLAVLLAAAIQIGAHVA